MDEIARKGHETAVTATTQCLRDILEKSEWSNFVEEVNDESSTGRPYLSILSKIVHDKVVPQSSMMRLTLSIEHQ